MLGAANDKLGTMELSENELAFVEDFCARLNELPNQLIEISCTNWTQAFYFNHVTPEVYLDLIKARSCLGWINGIDRYHKFENGNIIAFHETYGLRKPTTRVTKAEHCKSKNIFVFDLDMEKFHFNFTTFSEKKQDMYLRLLTEYSFTVLRDMGFEPYYSLASGHGLHISVYLDLYNKTKTKTWYDTPREYILTYENIVNEFEQLLNLEIRKHKKMPGVIFDRSVKNANRIFRLPLSTNYKIPTSPVPTKLIHYEKPPRLYYLPTKELPECTTMSEDMKYSMKMIKEIFGDSISDDLIIKPGKPT